MSKKGKDAPSMKMKEENNHFLITLSHSSVWQYFDPIENCFTENSEFAIEIDNKQQTIFQCYVKFWDRFLAKQMHAHLTKFIRNIFRDDPPAGTLQADLFEVYYLALDFIARIIRKFV